MIVSRRDYASMRHVSTQAIDQAVRRGLIEQAADGRIDVEQADAAWFRRHQARVASRELTAEAEGRRERALLQTAVAKTQMLRAALEERRAALLERTPAAAMSSGLVAQYGPRSGPTVAALKQARTSERANAPASSPRAKLRLTPHAFVCPTTLVRHIPAAGSGSHGGHSNAPSVGVGPASCC